MTRGLWNLFIVMAAFVPVVALYSALYWPGPAEEPFTWAGLLGAYVFFGPYSLTFWWILLALLMAGVVSRLWRSIPTRKLVLMTVGSSAGFLFAGELIWRWRRGWLPSILVDGGVARFCVFLVASGFVVGLICGGFSRIAGVPLLRGSGWRG